MRFRFCEYLSIDSKGLIMKKMRALSWCLSFAFLGLTAGSGIAQSNAPVKIGVLTDMQSGFSAWSGKGIPTTMDSVEALTSCWRQVPIKIRAQHTITIKSLKNAQKIRPCLGKDATNESTFKCDRSRVAITAPKKTIHTKKVRESSSDAEIPVPNP